MHLGDVRRHPVDISYTALFGLHYYSSLDTAGAEQFSKCISLSPVAPS
jgi:hypothetical protein